MSTGLIHDGRPIVVVAERERIASGPWARLLVSAVLPDESSHAAERGRVLARSGAVHGARVEEGTLAARVGEEHEVTIAAGPVPPRVWAAIARSARGDRAFQAAIDGRAQSVHLEHQMKVDWEEPLVPARRDLVRTCSCGEAPGCEHLAAAVYVFAAEIDRDPSLLLLWRGCVDKPEDDPVPAPPPERVAADGDPWLAGPLPELAPRRPLPVGAVLKRLGPSGLRVGGDDLADVLQRAYAAFAASAPPTPRA